MIEYDYGGVSGRLSGFEAEALGRALSVLGLAPKVGVMSYNKSEAAANIAMGAAKVGCSVSVYGEGRFAHAQFAAKRDGLCCMAFVTSECRVYLLGGYGYLSRRQLTAVKRAQSCDIHAQKGGAILQKEYRDDYKAAVMASVCSLDDCYVPFADRGRTEAEISSLAESLGAATAYRGYGYTATAGGRRAYYTDETGGVIGYWQLVLLCCNGRHTVCLPRYTPQGVTAFLRSKGVQVVLSDRDIEPFTDDAALLVLTAEKNLALTGMTSGEVLQGLPRIYAAEQYVSTDVLPSVLGESGVRINYRGGSVCVIPDVGGYRIYAEGVSSEIAEEICEQTKKRVK